MPAIGYGRKSVVRDERDTISVDRQRAAIERLAAERNEPIVWFEDAEGHRSGRSERARPGFGSLLSRLQNDPTVSTVIVYELDRAGRSVATIDKLLKLCQARNVTFISIRDGIDTSRGMGANETFRIHMQASAAEWYANITSDKMKATAADYRERLHIPWGMWPFGFDRVGHGEDSQLRPAPTHADTVRQLLSLYAGGLSYDAVSNALNDRQLRHLDRAGLPKRWTREGVRSVVGNVLFYAGYAIVDRWKSKECRIELDGQGSYLERYARHMRAVRSPAIEPIIDLVMANSVIERRYHNQHTGRRPLEWTPLLTPILYCDGQKLRADTTRHGAHIYRSRDGGIWIDADAPEGEMIGRLSRLQFPDEMVWLIRESVAQRTGDTERRQLQERLEGLNAAMERLVALHVDGVIKREHYNTQFAELERSMRFVQTNLQRPTDVERVMRQLGDVGAAVEMMTADNRKRAVHKLLDRVQVTVEGEISGLQLRPWAKSAFADLAQWYANDAPGEPSARRWQSPDLDWFVRMAA